MANVSGVFLLLLVATICLYTFTRLYLSQIHNHQNYIYHNHSTQSTAVCPDPVQYISPYGYILKSPDPYVYVPLKIGRPLHQTMILSHGFKNRSCVYYMENAFCAQYNSTHRKKEFCNGGYMIWKPDHRNVNHFKKSRLYKTLSIFCNIYHKTDNVCNFKLLSYNMDDIQQRIEFITNHIDCTNTSDSNKQWVFKVNKHQGIGIHFYNNHQLIYTLLKPNKIEESQYYNKCKNVSTLQTSEYFKRKHLDYIKRSDHSDGGYRLNYKNLVMQEFISNPLLIDNRAFHIRTLHLIVTIGHSMVVLQYSRWQICRNPLEYNNSNAKTLKSNYHQTRNVEIVESVHFKRFWGYNRFTQHLRENYISFAKETKKMENSMQNDMSNITATIFKARAFLQLNQINEIKLNNKTVLKFDVLCMDTVMNAKFELKFLEINLGCGCSCASDMVDMVGDDNQFCGAFADETSNILMEIYEKHKNGTDIINIASLNQFKMVYVEK